MTHVEEKIQILKSIMMHPAERILHLYSPSALELPCLKPAWVPTGVTASAAIPMLASMERVTQQSPPLCQLLPQPGIEPALMALHLQQS